jgi:hypothetical protein
MLGPLMVAPEPGTAFVLARQSACTRIDHAALTNVGQPAIRRGRHWAGATIHILLHAQQIYVRCGYRPQGIYAYYDRVVTCAYGRA